MSSSANLLNEVLLTTKILGDTKTIQVLQNARKKKIVITESLPIIEAVLSVFGLDYSNLPNNIQDLEQKKLIISLLVFFLKTSSKLKSLQINIAIGTNYTPQRITQYYNIVKNCKFENPKSPLDIKIALYHSQITQKLKDETTTTKQ